MLLLRNCFLVLFCFVFCLLVSTVAKALVMLYFWNWNWIPVELNDVLFIGIWFMQTESHKYISASVNTIDMSGSWYVFIAGMWLDSGGILKIHLKEFWGIFSDRAHNVSVLYWGVCIYSFVKRNHLYIHKRQNGTTLWYSLR